MADFPLSAGTILAFVQNAPAKAATNTISFAQTGVRAFTLAATNTVSLLSGGTWHFETGASNALAFAQTIGITINLTKVVADAVTFATAVNIIILRVSGHGLTCTDGYTPVPVLGSRSTTVLTFPYVTPTSTVTLRNSEFGNTQDVDLGVIHHTNESGTIRTGAPSYRGFISTFSYRMRGLSQTVRDELEAFYSASAGKEIGILDHENRQWRGIITSTIPVIRQTGRTCLFTSGFNFVGTVVI